VLSQLSPINTNAHHLTSKQYYSLTLELFDPPEFAATRMCGAPNLNEELGDSSRLPREILSGRKVGAMRLLVLTNDGWWIVKAPPPTAPPAIAVDAADPSRCGLRPDAGDAGRVINAQQERDLAPTASGDARRLALALQPKRSEYEGP